MNNIIHWNVNGFRPRLESIKLLINEYNPSVLCVQETNFKKDCTSSLTNFKHFYRNRDQCSHASGGVATFVNNKFHSEEIPIDTVFEAIVIEAYIPRKIHIANIYLPNSQAFTYDDFLHLINQIPKPFLICGDFNSHNPLWGSNTLDTRGKIIEKILLQNDLTLLNTKESTHYNLSSNSYSAIDLSLYSPDIIHLLDWQVQDAAWDSDHFPCKIHIENDQMFKKNQIPQCYLGKTKPLLPAFVPAIRD